MQLQDFSQFVEDIKQIKSRQVPLSKLESFTQVLTSFHELQLKVAKSRKNLAQGFATFLRETVQLREDIYTNRLQETQALIQLHRDKLRISCFELMEHNFRENTHSNILQYLFDFRYFPHAPDVLHLFLNDSNTSIPNLKEKLSKRTYHVLREKSTGKGRIDLLIVDRIEKFVIVIENKLLADVSQTDEVDEEKQVTRTQLDKYVAYIQSNYSGYHALYILLSYKPVETSYPPYHLLDYQSLYASLTQITSSDTIFNEYLLLLKTLISTPYDKTWMLAIARRVEAGGAGIHLNYLELLNNLLLA